MNKAFILLIISTLITIVCGQEMDQEKMAAYMELANPGPEHQMLEKMTGTWQQTVKMWMQPGAEAIESSGQSVNEMILGGRFLQSHLKGGEGPMAIESLNIMGYDRRNKKFTTVGFDTWGTYYVTAAGPYHEDRKAIIMYGEDEDTALNLTQKYDIIVRFIDENTYITEVVFKDFPAAGDGEFKMVEVLNTRVK